MPPTSNSRARLNLSPDGQAPGLSTGRGLRSFAPPAVAPFFITVLFVTEIGDMLHMIDTACFGIASQSMCVKSGTRGSLK